MVRRAVILPVVLFVLLLVGLLGAMFAFRVNADLASTQAVAQRLQTRLAAEAGVEMAKILLQTERFNMDSWYHNPDELHRIVMWAYDGDTSVWGTNSEDFDEGAMVYRFSLVADDPTDDEDYVRFGLTDESSKLHLNLATEAQLLTLVSAVVEDDEEMDPQQIVDAILDWRDPDSVSRGEEEETEGEYYRNLDKPYRIKNGPFDTVEELLLVKGVTNEILYGEDFDRNGLLTPNEEDGDESFPLDNQDDELNQGLYPYLTVVSYDENVSNDRRPRIYLAGEEASVREELSLEFEEEPEVVDFIIAATRGQGSGGGTGLPGSAGSGAAPAAGQPGGAQPIPPGTSPQPTGGRRGPSPLDSTGRGGSGSDGKESTRQQRREDGSEGDTEPTEGGEEEPEGEDAKPPEGGETDDAGSGAGPMRSPASLLRPQMIGGQEQPSPIGPEHLAVLLDRTTLIPPEQRQISGLINVNTAPRRVLECLDGLTDEQIEGILEVRETLDGEDKATPAWLLTEEVLDLETFERIAPAITARGQQFTIDALGYADHIGMVTRLHVVVDMIGPIAQTIYYRDLSYLGGHFPIREEDLEKLRVR
jgi:type II secretory pathway component PulK